MTFTGRLFPYQVDDTNRMIARGNMLAAYDMGCIYGDAQMTINRAGKGFTIPLRDLVRMQNGGERHNHLRWDQSIPTMVQREEPDGTVRLARLLRAWESGVKVTYTVTTATGRTIRATDEHPFLTEQGWKRLDELRPGDEVHVRGGRTSGADRKSKPRYKERTGLRLHPLAYQRDVPHSPHRVAEHRLVVEAEMNSLTLPDYLSILRAGDSHPLLPHLLFLDPDQVVHHRDGDPGNNLLPNLGVLSDQAAHNVEHRVTSRVLLKAVLEEVVSVERHGEEPTYDIEVADAPHNFIADGFVVHNTGKTVLTIAALERMMDSGRITEPGMVIVLSSLKYQWAQQVAHFSGGSSRALVIDGTPKQREALYAEAMDWRETGVDYIVLGYSQVVDDWETVKNLPRGFIVADEVTAIKSFRAQRSRKVKALGRRSPHRFGLTATPIENGKPEELFSIMEFVDPKVLGPYPDFDEQYVVRNPWGWPESYINLNDLTQRLQPVMVRKSQTDPDVAPYLPDTIQREPILVRLDPAARKLYKTVSDELLLDLDLMQAYVDQGLDPEDPQMGAIKGKVMSKLTALRMICDHPALLEISATNTHVAGSTTGSKYAASLLDRGLLPQHPKTPKMDAVAQYVADHLEVPGHKAVIFSVFVPTLDLLAQRLAKFGTATYSGSMNAKEKEAAKVRFQTDPEVRVLISSDAGGYGVDLPQANLLVNYDLPWAHGAAKQRNGRIQRASSKWPSVTIQDFLIQGSVEVRQHEALSNKGSIARAIIDGLGTDKSGGLSLSPTSLRQFLKTPGL